MSAAAKPSILVVEDEADIRELIALHLGREGYAVETLGEGEQALGRVKEGRKYDLFVLDWMLPGVSGLNLARAIRGSDGPERDRPILMVTARAEGADVVLGLEAGADDYVTKPFEIPVLLARVRALLRRGTRGQAEPGDGWLRAGRIAVDVAGHEARCGDRKLELTPSEFKLLVALCGNRGRVLTRDKLIDLVQGEGVNVVDRAIDTHVFGLRKKLGECAEIIETVRGVGYRVRPSED